MSVNADQVEYWNGPGADRWVRYQDVMDRSLEPFGRAALEAASPRAGERVVDIGCGCGWTSLALAEAVGREGAILGVDVSAPMLGLARRRAQEKGLANVTFQVADASTHSLEPSFDLLFSRFGVMFFDDPASAFRNLRRALRPGGRLAFVCWGPVVDNPWYRVPMEAASAVVSLPAPPAPGAPGPFAFGDRVRLTELLERAGFRDVRIDASAPRFVLGPELESAATHAVNAGPVSRVLLEVDEPTRARVRAAIMDRLQAYAGADGIALPASTWVVRAN